MKLANSRLLLYVTVFATRLLGQLSVRLAGPTAYLLWFTPWTLPVSERGLQKQAGWLESTERFTLRTTAGRVAGFTAGDGPLIVLVHGWGERAAGLGGFIAPLRDAGFRVVGFDLPAHGASEGQITYGPLGGAVALREVVDHFGPAHAVIAHSVGGNVALLAMRAGLRVDRVVLIAPNVDVTQTLDTFQRMFRLPSKAMAGLRRRIERRFGPSIWREVSVGDYAPRTETPALVFHDPDDPQVPFVGSERLVRGWPGAELVTTPGLGHGAITREQAVIERAVGFVSEATARADSG